MADFVNTIRWEQRENGVILLTLDDPNQSANTMNADYLASMEATVDRLEKEKDEIAGVVITSAKKTFFAGGDLNGLIAVGPDDAPRLAGENRQTKVQLRRLETFGKPVVAAINGTALGGGLELTLACHHRICVDDPRIKLGFPEVTLGLLPGAGGVVRSVRMVGVIDALKKWLLKGQTYGPAAAMELGFIDATISPEADLVAEAAAWITERDEPFQGQPWDRSGYAIPGGTPSSGPLAALLQALPATLRKELKGANYPAQRNILAAAVEGAQVDLASAESIEGRYFVDLAAGRISKNMIKAFFFDMQAVSGPRGRQAAGPPRQYQKVVVLGAGMMGAAIAFVCAKAGLEVVLKDLDQSAAERGKGYSERLVDKDLKRGRISEEEGSSLLDRILASDDAADASGADLVIEAVFEDPEIKSRVFTEIEPHLAPDALLGSNTSTLPISQLAANVGRPDAFIGLHFFSPVDRMPLIEIVRGEQTSEETLGRALDLAKQIRKTPIVVSDSRGFLTSRVIATFINEGIGMVGEGTPPASIEQASSQAGYPAPVLQLSDELSTTLSRKIANAAEAANDPDFSNFHSSGALKVIDQMLDRFDRPGRQGGGGFYEYVDGKRSRFWPGLSEAFPGSAPPEDVNLEDLTERLLFVESLESVKCLNERVVESVSDANVGSILGIGFPGWTGGVLQYINGYQHPRHGEGPAGFVARARELSSKYGERFNPPDSLVQLAAEGGTYV